MTWHVISPHGVTACTTPEQTQEAVAAHRAAGSRWVTVVPHHPHHPSCR